MKKILVLNSGSSSLKYQLFEVSEQGYDVVAKGNAERIGDEGSFVSIKAEGKDKLVKNINLKDHNEAISEVFELLLKMVLKSVDEIDAVGHRVVHGGEYFKKSALVTPENLKRIEELAVLAPLHNPAAVLGINAISALLPNVPQVTVFDTAFHQTMQEEAYLYSIPYEQYTENKIRRYGFHGTSHMYVARKAAELMGKNGKFVTCHIGNGASISAVDNGVCLDTSMGFTPLAGVTMGTRCGDIDPYIPLHIMKYQNKSVDEVNEILNKKSGMLGLSGYGDLRDIEDKYMEGDKVAARALKVYVHNIIRFIGSYIAVMGGVDAIIFTAGVGENSSIIRKMVCDKLAYLGIEIDDFANDRRGGDVAITTKESKVTVYIISTDEELMIAKDTMNLI